ncbi:serine/threonine-protein kinase [Streptomyces sp. NPDC050617]|uniref:serine/threonine-protein kinase n=1 Tax=Streptomyces sp. NPDC050617 TaxID=3154628 RepID=UPI003437C6D2
MIDGRFELVDRLGGGGMGTVWRARDLALHRDVALKEVRPPDPAYADHDPEGARTLRARVLREARALARIDHPNVVTIHHIVDAGEDTYPWLVMELVTGGSLQDRLDRGPMTPADAARLGRDVLAALRAAHAGGIEHRDVKPANVLLRPDGRPVLTDFGIAALRESTSLTATGSVIGSPDYMAPERVRGRPCGPAGDLWSLALMLYVAVEDHHPLRRESTLATLAAVLDAEVPPPRRAGALTDALVSVLVRDPEARPDAEALDAMLAAASGAEDTASGQTTSYHLTPPTPSPPNAPSPSDTPRPPSNALPPGDARRQVRRARTNMAAVAVAGATLTGILLWGVLHWSNGESNGESTETAGTATAAGKAGTPGANAAAPQADQPSMPKNQTDEPAEGPDLLTPDGIRTAIRKLKPVMGGTKVTRLIVYPEHVSAEALVKGSEKRYDRFGYRGGDVAVREGAGGTITNGDVPADLSSFDWKALPELLRRAQRELGVDRPTSRYLVVTPASTVFGNSPSMSVYLSDAYGSGYLKADRDGKVIATYPREK